MVTYCSHALIPLRNGPQGNPYTWQEDLSVSFISFNRRPHQLRHHYPHRMAIPLQLHSHDKPFLFTIPLPLPNPYHRPACGGARPVVVSVSGHIHHHQSCPEMPPSLACTCLRPRPRRHENPATRRSTKMRSLSATPRGTVVSPGERCVRMGRGGGRRGVWGPNPGGDELRLANLSPPGLVRLRYQ